MSEKKTFHFQHKSEMGLQMRSVRNLEAQINQLLTIKTEKMDEKMNTAKREETALESLIRDSVNSNEALTDMKNRLEELARKIGCPPQDSKAIAEDGIVSETITSKFREAQDRRAYLQEQIRQHLDQLEAFI